MATRTRTPAFLQLITTAGMLAFWALFFSGAMSFPDGSLLAASALVFLALYDFGWEAAIAFDRTPLDRVTPTVLEARRGRSHTVAGTPPSL